PTGVYGESARFGVVGKQTGAPEPAGAGVIGIANQSGSNFNPDTGGSGVMGSGYIGVRGETASGVAVMGRIFGPGLAGKFEGQVEVTGNNDQPSLAATNTGTGDAMFAAGTT